MPAGLQMAGPAACDRPCGPARTPSESAEHVSGVYGYADYAGNLRWRWEAIRVCASGRIGYSS